jgi:phosphoribosyl-AMP cyclohydrolase
MMKLNFDKEGLIPVIAQDFGTGAVLMLAYANREAVDQTLATGYAHYYSRSRRKLWKKGEESGNFQKVISVLVDCDEDTLVYQVEQVGGAACHTGHATCFYRTIEGKIIAPRIFDPDEVYANKDE